MDIDWYILQNSRIAHTTKTEFICRTTCENDVYRNNLRTWLVQTLLNATKANVCASIVPARSFFANARGIKTALRASWGINARDSKRIEPDAGGTAEVRCRRVLYGEKL